VRRCRATAPLQAACGPAAAERAAQVFLLASASQAFLLNLCIFWCTTLNSPLATTVTGASPPAPALPLWPGKGGDGHIPCPVLAAILLKPTEDGSEHGSAGRQVRHVPEVHA